MSRQADAHIKIEVHRDIKIRNYLQNKQTENMNLMFYDFNGSSFGSANNTAQNFYKPNEQIESGLEPAERAQEVAQTGFRMNFRAEGDRVNREHQGHGGLELRVDGPVEHRVPRQRRPDPDAAAW